MAVEVILKRSHGALLQSVSAAFAGPVWETMQEGLHAAALFGRSRLCGIQQGTVGEAGVLKKTGRSKEGAHMWCTHVAGKLRKGGLKGTPCHPATTNTNQEHPWPGWQ